MDYALPPEATPHPNVPQGTVTEHSFEGQVFSGTFRKFWVYVPAQYRAEAPASLMIFQDGELYVSSSGDFRAPLVFDTLIHREQMPTTIGVFVNAGHQGSSAPATCFSASNRSYEYDSLTEKYSRFLVEELIPHLSTRWNISADPKQRAIAGLSSGGICAFTAAWHRPDCFHKVLSHVGSFTDIRGGHNYPSWIRQWPKRDIKVFLQSGENDLETQFGNWWLANQTMASALKWRGYDHQFVGGKGGHDGKHGGAILPESLRWLWSAS